MSKIDYEIGESVCEQIRTSVLVLLRDEFDNQMALSGDIDYDFDYYLERFTPYSEDEEKPVLNVGYLRSDPEGGDVFTKFYRSIYHIDMMFSQKETEGDTDGGDTVSAKRVTDKLFKAQHVLMHHHYRNLGISEGLIKTHNISEISQSPTEKGLSSGNEVAGMLILEVVHQEFDGNDFGTEITSTLMQLKTEKNEYGIKLLTE